MTIPQANNLFNDRTNRLAEVRGYSHLSILFAFLLIAAFLLFGLPWLLAWPIFLALPLGLLQILQMVKLADGSKPNWKLLWVNSLGTFLILVYLISFTLWVK